MRRQTIQEGDGRRGIALVLVLGFLATITVLAVAFAVSMRTERLATRNYVDLVRAQQMAHVALGRALEQLEQQIGNNVYPPSTWYASTGAAMTPALVVTGGESSRAIPTSVYPNAATVSATGWMDLTGGGVTGRVAWLSVDCSGLLDASLVGASPAVPRGIGAGPQEMQLATAVLPEIVNPVTFLNLRTSTYKRFEMVEDITAVGRADAWLNAPAINLFPFSYFPDGYYRYSNGVATNAVFIGGASTGWSSQADIERAFTTSGLTAAQATDAYNALKDYVDADNTPYDLNRTSVEPVPMINEVVVQSAGTNVAVYVEAWYPWARASTSSFMLEGTAVFAGYPAASGTVTLPPVPIATPAPNTYWPTAPTQVLCPTITNGVTTVTFNLTVKEGAAIVDQATVVITGNNNSKQCLDPRFNGQPAAPYWTQYPIANQTISVLNVNAAAGCIAAGKDGDTAMFTKNAPLESLGELGYLPLEPWRTVKLYGPTMHPVVDKFTLSNPPAARKGLINPNSSVAAVLGTVYNGMPMDQYPGQGGAYALSAAQSVVVGSLLVSASTYTNNAQFGQTFPPFDAANAAYWNGLCGGTSDELRREAVVRNACGLLNIRQNLFTILVAGQSVSLSGPTTNQTAEVLAEARGAAVVWRDPYFALDMDGRLRHRTFVRSFRWLKE